MGNPFSIADIKEGSTVLDIGCGSGIDLVVAGQLVGESGKVTGVDITPAMVEKTQKLLNALTLQNCQVELIDSEKLPFADNSFDTVISNGVINLSPDKATLFDEIFRILKPNGQLQFADIIVEKELPDRVQNVQDWSD